SDDLWRELVTLFPPAKPSPRGGRPRADDRACLEGILWVLFSGSRWCDLPSRLPSAVTCWRRLRELEAAGVWLPLWRAYLAQLGEEDMLAWSRVFAGPAPSAPAGTPVARPKGEKGHNGFWRRMADQFRAQTCSYIVTDAAQEGRVEKVS